MAQPPPNTFGPEVLLVFIGHSDDAAVEATALVDIEQDLQRVLERHQEVANGALPYKTVRVWEWSRDARVGVGGQDQVIAPVIDRANAAVFVFKERIGETTWAELEHCRDRNGEVAVLACFPASAPEGMRMTEPAVVAGWLDLLRKKEELTRDWNLPSSRSLTPVDGYVNADHLKALVISKLEVTLAALLRSHPPETPAAPPPRPGKLLGGYEDLSYDRRPVLAHIVEELDGDLLRDFLDRPMSQEPSKIRPRPTVSERLQKLGLASDGHPTLGALLCFAPPPLLVDKLDGCGVQLVIYSGTDRASSRPSITPIRGNLLTLFDDTLRWLTTQSGLRRRGRVGTADRDELEIPEIVLREVVANALVHRDYETPELKDQPTRVEVYADRVEVTSFGSLPRTVRIESLNTEPEDVVPNRRNPLIARVFQHMSHVELNASGVPRMRSEMEKAGLPPPRFTQSLHESVVRVVLLRPSDWADAPALPSPSREPGPGELPRVFISSTVEDLRQHRRSVADACLRLGFMPIAMEHFRAEPSNIVEHALEQVDRADVYVGIFAHRYGYIPPGHDQSLAELEYNRAIERGIPCLIYLIHDEHPVRPSDIEAGPGAERLARLKERIQKERIVWLFKSPEDLRGMAIESLGRVRNQLLNARLKEPEPSTTVGNTGLPVPPEAYVAHPYTPGTAFVGRQKELKLLSDWISAPATATDAAPVFCITGLGGIGKTALAWQWFTERPDRDTEPLAGQLWWSFYEDESFDEFVAHALAYVSRRTVDEVMRLPEPDRERQLLSTLDREPHLLVLDGVERLLLAYSRVDQDGSQVRSGLRQSSDARTGQFFRLLAGIRAARILITTRLFLAELQSRTGLPIPGVRVHSLTGLADSDATTLWKELGVHGPDDILLSMSRQVDNHPLALTLFAGEVSHYRRAPGDLKRWLQDHPSFRMGTGASWPGTEDILRFALRGLDEKDRPVLTALAAHEGQASYEELSQLLVGTGRHLDNNASLDTILDRLEDRGLIGWDRRANLYSIHPIVRTAVLHPNS